MPLLRYLPEGCDGLMRDSNQHVQEESVVMTSSLCTVSCLKHMIDGVLNLLNEDSCGAVGKKVLVNDNDNLLSLSHDQAAIQCNVSDTIKGFCYLFCVPGGAVALPHQWGTETANM